MSGSGIPPNIPPSISITPSSPESSPPPEDKKTSGNLGGKNLEQVPPDSRTSNEVNEMIIGGRKILVKDDYVPEQKYMDLSQTVRKSESFERSMENLNEDYLGKDRIQRDKNTQFDNDLDKFMQSGENKSGDLIPRMMKYVEERSFTKSWDRLETAFTSSTEETLLERKKDDDPNKPEWRWPLMPDEMKILFAQRMARAQTQPARLNDVMIAIDGLKKGTGTNEEINKLNDRLNDFVRWARTRDPDIPKNLLQEIETFRVNRAMQVHDLDQRMDLLGVPHQAREPLREALRLYEQWRAPPEQPPPLLSSYNDEQEMQSAVAANEDFPGRMREWENGGFREIPGRLREQLQMIENVPNHGIPDIMLRDLRRLSYRE
jgi:hypothetical protein